MLDDLFLMAHDSACIAGAVGGPHSVNPAKVDFSLPLKDARALKDETTRQREQNTNQAGFPLTLAACRTCPAVSHPTFFH